MKRLIICSSICSILFASAVAQKSDAQKKIEFTYPDDIVDSAKKGFVKQFYQGHTLYKITCSRCHTKTVNNKEIIPDFSLPQLMDYEIRIWPQHQEDMPETKITEGELGMIVLFLRYKKRNEP